VAFRHMYNAVVDILTHTSKSSVQHCCQLARLSFLPIRRTLGLRASGMLLLSLPSFTEHTLPLISNLIDGVISTGTDQVRRSRSGVAPFSLLCSISIHLTCISVAMPLPERAVFLITGCSTGLGRAFAEKALSHGHRVIATGRKLETIQDLEEKGASVLKLDVNAPRDDLKTFAKQAWNI
jgi:hypothetical protein